MFVKRTVKHRGETVYEYLALVEAVRVEGKNTHRTLFRLGEVSELRESGQLDRIVKALATYANGTYVEAGEIEGLGSPSFGAVAAAWSYFRRLGLERQARHSTGPIGLGSVVVGRRVEHPPTPRTGGTTGGTRRQGGTALEAGRKGGTQTPTFAHEAA
jgi:hypothetical protein